jgi:hypothetical protein
MDKANKIQLKNLIFIEVKILASILSIYFLALSVMPCRDGKDFGVNKSALQTSIQQNTPCSDTQDETCSPLCTCSCCGVNAILYPLTNLTTLSVNEENKFSMYQQSRITEVSYSIWQPPKLS